MTNQAHKNLTPTEAGSDGALLKALAGGDSAALDQLYLRHGPALLAYLQGQLPNRQLAEEVLQDVMLAAWRGASNFRGESSVRSWLLAIGRNRAISARQKLNKQAHHALDEEAEIIPAKIAVEEAIEREDEQAELRQALQQLPPEQRETLELVFYQELPAAEVAVVLGISPGTVKSRLHRAKAALRKILENDTRK